LNPKRGDKKGNGKLSAYSCVLINNNLKQYVTVIISSYKPIFAPKEQWENVKRVKSEKSRGFFWGNFVLGEK
jgi:hypothetical protein